MRQYQGHIEDYLGLGAKNARSTRELQRMLGLSERELRRLVERRRLDGVEILASKEGGSDCGTSVLQSQESGAS